MSRRILIGLVVVLMAIAGLTGWAIAATTTVSGKGVTSVRIVRGSDTVGTSSTDWSTIASATTQIPSNTKAILLLRFSGSSACFGGDINDWCSVRILVNGVEAEPADGAQFRFDSVSSSSDIWNWESHAMDRSTGVLQSGSYSVQVQLHVTNGLTTFNIDDWSLVVERIRA